MEKDYQLTTTDFINNLIGNKARIFLTNNESLVGNLITVDNSFNIVLSDVEKTDIKNNLIEKYKDIFIRGNNIRLIEEIN